MNSQVSYLTHDKLIEQDLPSQNPHLLILLCSYKMDKFLNKKYKLDRCENLDEMLKELGRSIETMKTNDKGMRYHQELTQCLEKLHNQ